VTIGIVPGQPFDPSTLDPVVAKALGRSLSVALQRLHSSAAAMGTAVYGWHVPPANLGNFASDYRSRAYIALIAFGANLPRGRRLSNGVRRRRREGCRRLPAPSTSAAHVSAESRPTVDPRRLVEAARHPQNSIVRRSARPTIS
jgi:hypothetical protein